MSRYRLVYVGLTLALVVIVLLGIAFGSPDRPGAGRPEQVESVTPAPGETVLRQARLEIDALTGYELEIFVDGLMIPEEELFIVEGTGVHSFIPGPARTFTEWAPGQHEVRVRWQTRTGLPDVGEYSWTFRAY